MYIVTVFFNASDKHKTLKYWYLNQSEYSQSDFVKYIGKKKKVFQSPCSSSSCRLSEGSSRPGSPTWCSPVYSKSFRPWRSTCRTRPGTDCTRHISDRRHATPGPGRPAGCTGRVFGSHSPRTETPAASLEEQHEQDTSDTLFTTVRWLDSSYNVACQMAFIIVVISLQ